MPSQRIWRHKLTKCGGKPSYLSKEEAARVRSWMLNRNGQAPQSIGAYPCEHCGGHHVGHRRQDKNEARFGNARTSAGRKRRRR